MNNAELETIAARHHPTTNDENADCDGCGCGWPCDAATLLRLFLETDLPLTEGWTCPVHERAVRIPAGISRNTGRPYTAFSACLVTGCPEREPWNDQPCHCNGRVHSPGDT